MSERIIYLVDDEPSIIDPLAYVLTTDGFQVESFTLGQQLQARMAEQQPDLIVLDVGLPDINGFDLFRSIRAEFDIPILFLTARSDGIDRIVGLELGADDYVVKPFSPREVVARIRVIIRRYHAAPVADSTGEKANLDVNRNTATATFFGQSLQLTRYEFLLLAFLADQPQRVFSRGQLLEAIWPDSSGSMERSVDTHIKTLRAKLKSVNDGTEVIKTHRGLGYSLELP